MQGKERKRVAKNNSLPFIKGVENTMGEFYDVYLWIYPKTNILYVIRNLTYENACKYGYAWFDISDLHDYSVVKSGKPLSEEQYTIYEKTPEWISLENTKVNGGTNG